MTTLRRILTGAALASIVAGLASADNIISYTASTGSLATDLSNQQLLVANDWAPGAAGDTILSNQGTTMASLNAANTTYTLQWFDITVTSAISGSWTITAGGSGSSGSAQVGSYTAVALDNPLSPALGNGVDATNDLFYDGSQPGAGPDPLSANTPFNLAANGSVTTPYTNVHKTADLCDYLVNGDVPAYSNCAGNAPPGLGPAYFGLVEGTPSSQLNFFLSTYTTLIESVSGGNNNGAQSTNVNETVTVTYDYTATTASSTPEPATMVLFGAGLLGLGFFRKRRTNR